jgi:hypothetical protein
MPEICHLSQRSASLDRSSKTMPAAQSRRMPVILPTEAYDLWLDPHQNADALALLEFAYERRDFADI